MKIWELIKKWLKINMGNIADMHNVKDVGAFYNQYNDKFLQTYGEVIQSHRTHDIRILLDYQIEAMQLKAGMKVLDAGCGVCGPACYFAEKTGAEIHALTISEEQVKKSIENIAFKHLEKKVSVKKGDFHDIKMYYPDVQYDVVYFLESFGHSPFHTKAIDSAWKVLKPGGLLYIKDMFKRLMLLPEYQSIIDKETKEINDEYRYNVANLNEILDHVRKQGWIVSALKTIDLKTEDFENYVIAGEFQQLTGVKKQVEKDYIFPPVDFFELFLNKPH